jgi:hypothetical protein
MDNKEDLMPPGPVSVSGWDRRKEKLKMNPLKCALGAPGLKEVGFHGITKLVKERVRRECE